MRAHHDKVHVGRKINDVVSRMPLTHELLHGRLGCTRRAGRVTTKVNARAVA